MTPKDLEFSQVICHTTFKQSNYTDIYHHKNPELIQLIGHAANKIYDRDSY